MYGFQYVRRAEATAAKRRFYFFLRDATDGLTPEAGETNGQPQISTDGAAFTDTGIGLLVAITAASGYYYAEATEAAVTLNNGIILARFKSGNTIESPALNAFVVGGDLGDAIARLSNTVNVTKPSGAMSIKEADGTTERFPLTTTEDGDDAQELVRP